MASPRMSMCEGPFLKKILLYTLPIILTGLLQLTFNAADLIIVGQFCGSISVAAVGTTGALTNLIVNLIKNFFIIIGVLIAMVCLNYMLTIMVLCFVPFIVLFTVVFRKFSRKAYRRVKDGTTEYSPCSKS